MHYDRKLSQIIAEESQLLMELKWIKEALLKIKTQRNCLQVKFIKAIDTNQTLLSETFDKY